MDRDRDTEQHVGVHGQPGGHRRRARIVVEQQPRRQRDAQQAGTGEEVAKLPLPKGKRKPVPGAVTTVEYARDPEPEPEPENDGDDEPGSDYLTTA